MSSTRVLSSEYTAHPTRQLPTEKSAAEPTAARCYQQQPIMSIAMTTTAVPEDDVMNEESNSPPSSSISTSSSSLCSNIINRSVEQHSKDGLSIINGNKKSCFNPDNIIDKNSCFTDKSNQMATAYSNDSKSSDTTLKDTSDRPVKKNKVLHLFNNGHPVTDGNQTADPSNTHSQSGFSNLDAKISSSTDMVKSNAFSISQTLNNKCNNNINITNTNGVFYQKHHQQQQQKRINCYISSSSTLLPSSSLAHMNSPPTYANINTFNTNSNFNNFTLSTNVTNDSNKDINLLNTVSSATTVSRDWSHGPEQTTNLTVTKSLPLSINLSSVTSPPLYDASSDNQKMVVHKGPTNHFTANSNDTKDNCNSQTYMNRNVVEDQLTFLASVSSPLSPFNFNSHYGGVGGLTLPSVGSPIGMNSTGGFSTHQTHQQQAYYNNINSFYTNLLFQQQQHNPNLNPKINSTTPSNIKNDSSIKDIPNHFNNSTNNNFLQSFYPNFSGGCQYSYPHPNNINTSSNSNNNNNNTSLESSAVVETRFESSAPGYRGQSPPVAVSVTTATAAVAMTTTSTNNGGTAAAVKRTRQTSHKFKNEMCRVCGDKASGYHYKAITCEGCKVFFLRCVATNAQFNACHSGGSCEMDLYTRRKCQYCRFAKCLAIGMKPECVILDRQKSSLAARSAHTHPNATSTNKMTNNNLMHNGTTPSSSLVNSPHTPLTPPTTLNDGQALDNAARNGMGYKTVKGNANTSLAPGANGKISALSIIQAAKQKAALLGPLTPNIVGEMNGVNNNNNTDLNYKNGGPTTELTSKSTTINNSSLNKKLNHLTNGKNGIGNGKTNNRQNHTKGHTHQAVNQGVIPTSSLHHRHNNQYVGGHTNGLDFGADTNFYLEESYKNSRVVNGLGLQQQRPIMSQMVSPSLGTSCYVNGGGIFSQHPNFMLNGNIPTPNAYNSMNVNGGGINTNTINNQFPLINETAMAHSIMASSGGCRPTTHKTERENNGDAGNRLTFTLYNDETNNYLANNNNQSMKQLTNGYDSNETNNKLTSPFMINHSNGVDNSNDNLYTDTYLKPDTLNYHNGNGSRKPQEVLNATSPLYHENNKFSNNNINDYNGTVGENKHPTNYNQPPTNGNLYESIGGLGEFHTNNSPLQAYPLKSEQKRLVERLVFYQDQFELPSAEVVKSIEEYSEQDTKSNANQKTFMKMAQFGMLNIQLIIEFSKRLPGFQSLLRQDQITILKACMYEIMLIKTARRYDLNTDTIVCCDNKPYTRDNFKNSGIVDVCDSMFDFCRGMATLKVDNAEYALLTAVCLFQERPALIEPKKVESIQEYYSDTLRSYVQARRPSGSNTLARLLVKLRDLREINNSHSSMLYSLKVQNFHIPPLMAEVWDLNSIGTPTTTTVENVSSNESFNSNKPLLLVNDDQMNSNPNPNPNNKGNKNVEKGTCFFVGGSHPSSENNVRSKTEKVQNLHEEYANYQFIETESPSALYKDVMHHQPTLANNLPSENGVSTDETHQTQNHCYDTFEFREGPTNNHQTKETKFTGHVNNQEDCLKHNTFNNFSPKAADSTSNGSYNNHVETNNQNLKKNENIQSNQYFNHLSPNISHTAFGNENKNSLSGSTPITNHKRKHSSP